MKFSILIANYNNGRFFKDCYDSIIAQTYTNWEAIIVDDASTDNSLELIKAQIGDDPRFVLVQNDQNGGCGYTKRRCAELATGEICGFLDPDDALMPEAVQVMVQEHLSYPESSLIYSNAYYCDEMLKTENIIRVIIPNATSYLESGKNLTHFVSFKLELYRMTIGIGENIKRAVDQDLYYKCEEMGGLRHVDKTLYKYRIHNGGISTNQNVVKAFSWHSFVIIEACKRRNIDFENILSLHLFSFINNTRSIDFKLGNFILKPLRILKGKLGY